MSKRCVFLFGLRDTIPLIVGTTPFAIIFGTLVVSAGLPAEMALALSAIVFAGSAQLISISLIGGGAPLPVIWLTTFVINLRHALYSATMQPTTRRWPLWWRLLGAFWLTDECFAVFERRMRTDGEQDSLPYYLGSTIPFYVNWVGWTALGAYLGNRIPGVTTLGLDFAMIATFTAMIAPQLKALTPVAVAATAGSVAWIAQGLPYKLGLLLAALAGVAVGVLLDYRQRRLAIEEHT
ncbi:MAG: AzlC family ABC transporter permease [Candidatus Accumulibacter sp.]|jgi:4-azaleucine resistance transporter AzlC|nr:AzlC family ABC transporter permease [Accumulibacter sp.]